MLPYTDTPLGEIRSLSFRLSEAIVSRGNRSTDSLGTIPRWRLQTRTDLLSRPHWVFDVDQILALEVWECKCDFSTRSVRWSPLRAWEQFCLTTSKFRRAFSVHQFAHLSFKAKLCRFGFFHLPSSICSFPCKCYKHWNCFLINLCHGGWCSTGIDVLERHPEEFALLVSSEKQSKTRSTVCESRPTSLLNLVHFRTENTGPSSGCKLFSTVAQFGEGNAQLNLECNSTRTCHTCQKWCLVFIYLWNSFLKKAHPSVQSWNRLHQVSCHCLAQLGLCTCLFLQRITHGSLCEYTEKDPRWVPTVANNLLQAVSRRETLEPNQVSGIFPEQVWVIIFQKKDQEKKKFKWTHYFVDASFAALSP